MYPIKFISSLNETDPELARREYLTRFVLFVTFIVSSFFSVVSLIVYLSGSMPLDTVLIYSALSITLFGAMFLTHSGYWRISGMIPLLLLYFPAVNANYIGGIDAPGNFMYAMLIMIVAIIYGSRKMWIAVFICIATFLTLAWMISSGMIKPFRSSENVFINRVVITSGSLIGVAFLIWVMGKSYRKEIEERIRVEVQLAKNNSELSVLNSELGAANEELEATNEEFEAINNELLRAQDDLLESNEKLKQSEQKFFQIFHSSPVPMTLNDLETGKYVEVNEAVLNAAGCTREQLIGRTPLEAGFFNIDQIRIINSSLKKTGSLKNYEFSSRLANGRELTVLMNSYVTTLNNRPCTISSTIDITEKKSAEENLIKTQRLESLGVIAGGLAHDFNNILMGILGNLSLARLNIDNHEETLAFIMNSEKACSRAQGLTRQLLTFSKGGLPVKKVFNPEKAARAAVEFNLAGTKVRAEINVMEKLWNIEADEGQISQVINNLVLNSVQSMPSGGTIEIKLENHIIRTEDVSIFSTGNPDPGKYVKMTFTDSGNGIPQDSLVKIFDPYYTTKQGGSGLGLSVVYSIITNHGGYVDVASIVKSGTTFSVYLPVYETSASSSGASVRSSGMEDIDLVSEGTSGKKSESASTILIMDDEESILSVLKGMLSYLGYKSAGAKSGSEAVELYKKALSSGNPYSAVIMDLTIPGDIGGKEVIVILSAIDPGVRAIVSSGYSDDPIFTDHSSYGFKAILRKPFMLDELSEALKKALS